jgi:formylmethanofuran dehydrogenase subunit A
MDRDLRAQWITTLPEAAMTVTTLPSIAREYTWQEIAIMTRAAPARLLGLPDRGHLAPGARADIAVYRPQQDRAAMFRNAELVFKDGRLVARNGVIAETVFGRALSVAPGHDRAADRRLAAWYDTHYGVPPSAFDVAPHAVTRADAFEEVPCAR